MSFPLLNLWRIAKLEASKEWDAPVSDSAKVSLRLLSVRDNTEAEFSDVFPIWMSGSKAVQREKGVANPQKQAFHAARQSTTAVEWRVEQLLVP